MTAPAQTLLDSWPVAATLAIVIAGDRVRATRRRNALNTALHELRRPLQILALGGPPNGTTKPARDGASPLELTWVALTELDRQINGGRQLLRPRLVGCRELIEGAAERWATAVELAGGQITLNARGAPTLLVVDAARLGQALDNMIANALEHGGPRVELDVSLSAQRVRIAVAGSGVPDRLTAGSRVEVSALLNRLGGRRRRGHGLRAVASIAARHGGRLLLTRSQGRTASILELPLAGAGAATAA
jgi:signal transduction histidine kinase